MRDAAMTTSLLLLCRALQYGSGMVLVGVVAFRWLILLPAFAAQTDEVWEKFLPLLLRLNRLFLGAGMILVLSALGLFWAVAAGMSDTSLAESLTSETLGAVFFQTQFGAVCQWRLGLAGLMVILTWRLLLVRWMLRRKCFVLEIVAGIIAAALVVAFAWTGHAAASGGPALFLRIGADALHLFVTSIWPAGLLPFAMFLAQARRLQDELPLAPVCKAVGRFSNVSLVIVVVLAVTGLINSYFIVGSFQALFTSTYGRVLGLKLSLFGVLLGIATYNRFRIVPQLLLCSAPQESISSAGPLLRRLQNLVLAEIALAIAIVLVVSVLGTTPPPQEAPPPSHASTSPPAKIV